MSGARRSSCEPRLFAVAVDFTEKHCTDVTQMTLVAGVLALDDDELGAEGLADTGAAAVDRVRAAGLRASSAIAAVTSRHNPSPAITRAGQKFNPWPDLNIMSPDYADKKWAATGAVPKV